MSTENFRAGGARQKLDQPPVIYRTRSRRDALNFAKGLRTKRRSVYVRNTPRGWAVYEKLSTGDTL